MVNVVEAVTELFSSDGSLNTGVVSTLLLVLTVGHSPNQDLSIAEATTRALYIEDNSV